MANNQMLAIMVLHTLFVAAAEKAHSLTLIPLCFQIRNLISSFLFGVSEGFSTLLATMQGLVTKHRSILRLDTLPNTINDFYKNWTLNFTTSPAPLSTCPWLLPTAESMSKKEANLDKLYLHAQLPTPVNNNFDLSWWVTNSIKLVFYLQYFSTSTKWFAASPFWKARKLVAGVFLCIFLCRRHEIWNPNWQNLNNLKCTLLIK